MNKLFEIKNGKNLIELIVGFGSYLKFRKPISINWSDRKGSVAQYFAIFPYNEEYREKIHEIFTSSLNEGIINIDEIFQIIEQLLHLFENGKYFVSYEKQYKYEVSENWNWELAYNTKLFSSSKQIQFERGKHKSILQNDIDYVSESYYDACSEYFIFTQPMEEIDFDRVKFYETLISNGQNPTAIIINGTFEETGIYEDGSKWISKMRSGSFIIDGHHKLLAYQNLNLTPSLIRIERQYSLRKEFMIDKNKINDDLKGYLYDSQLEHLLRGINNNT